MLGADRLYDVRPDPGDERAGDRRRFADLGDFYPAVSPPAQTVNGTQPVTPAGGGAAAVAGTGMNAPAVWVVAFTAIALGLMHWE